MHQVDQKNQMNIAHAVIEFQEKAEKSGLTGNSISLFRLIAGAGEMISGKPGYPPNQLVVNMVLRQLKSINPSLISSLISGDGYGRAMFFLPDLSDKTLSGFQELAKEISLSSGIQLNPVGAAFAMKEMNDKIIPQQFSSLLLAVILVIILTSLTQRSIKLGIISGFPIIITLLGLFGIMGYMHIKISVITGIMSGLTVGVGIDYAIHFVSLYRYKKRDGEEHPADAALKFVATPVLANAIGLAIGFTAMLLSPFQIHTTLSLLMWVTMILSSFLSLSLLPTILGGEENL